MKKLTYLFLVALCSCAPDDMDPVDDDAGTDARPLNSWNTDANGEITISWPDAGAPDAGLEQ